jgi:hypothetical protein
MRRALIVLCAFALDAALLERAQAGQVCAWIVESLDDDGGHKFELNLSADAPASVAARFSGPGFTSISRGGEMIQLDPGKPQDVDGEGFDVSAGDDLHFDLQLFGHSLASLEELDHPTGKPLAVFAFDRKVGAAERGPPPGFVKQCKPLG